MGVSDKIKAIHDRNRMKLPTKKTSADDLEQFILNSTVENLFGYLHHKMETEKKNVNMGIAWENVLYTIKCEPVENIKQAEEEFKRNIQ